MNFTLFYYREPKKESQAQCLQQLSPLKTNNILRSWVGLSSTQTDIGLLLPYRKDFPSSINAKSDSFEK